MYGVICPLKLRPLCAGGQPRLGAEAVLYPPGTSVLDPPQTLGEIATSDVEPPFLDPAMDFQHPR